MEDNAMNFEQFNVEAVETKESKALRELYVEIMAKGYEEMGKLNLEICNEMKHLEDEAGY